MLPLCIVMYMTTTIPIISPTANPAVNHIKFDSMLHWFHTFRADCDEAFDGYCTYFFF